MEFCGAALRVAMAAAPGGDGARPFLVIPEVELIFETGLPAPIPGGFGKVVQARYQGYLVAVKSVRTSLAASGRRLPSAAAVAADERAQLEQEIRVLARLRHPSLVAMLGVCYPASAPGEVWLVEELAECDLADFIDELAGRGRGLTLEHVCKLGLDIARGMAFMHGSGFSHNDLKANNVLLCKGSAAICDFGLVRAFTASLPRRHPSVGGAVGTLPYMAPENFSGRHPFYRRPTADVFSLGCILYEMATGQCPFAAESGSWGIAEWHSAVCVEGRRPALDGLDASLRALIARCWAANPAERPAAPELVTALTALYVGGRAQDADVAVLRRLVSACSRHGIRPDYIRALRNLEAFDIVLIADDSGSMAQESSQGDGTATTRWGELRDVARVVVDIAAAVDQDGLDVFFLNREELKNVVEPGAVLARFNDPPRGGTPLTSTLKRALHAKGMQLCGETAALAPGTRRSGKRLLFIIATDGEPDSDEGGAPGFTAALRALPENCFVQLVACTDDEEAVAWMDQLDGQVRYVDVNDDYHSERAQVLAAQGGGFAFSRADYIVKVLLVRQRPLVPRTPCLPPSPSHNHAPTHPIFFPPLSPPQRAPLTLSLTSWTRGPCPRGCCPSLTPPSPPSPGERACTTGAATLLAAAAAAAAAAVAAAAVAAAAAAGAEGLRRARGRARERGSLCLAVQCAILLFVTTRGPR